MESTPEQTAEGLAVVRVLGSVLERLITANVTLARADSGQVTKFHALKAPGIGILQYLERIHKYASCSTECFILALIYIDRLIQGNNFLLTELNVHRVVITSILLAAKFFDDAYYNNAYYAKVGGVLVSEMNRLEVEFLFRINFSLHVCPALYNKYHAELSAHAVGDDNCASPSCLFAQPADTFPQVSQVLSHYQHGNSESESQVKSHLRTQAIKSHQVPSQHYPEPSQYISSIPPQITPSPPQPQVHIPAMPPPPSTYCPLPCADTVQVHWTQKPSNGGEMIPSTSSNDQPYVIVNKDDVIESMASNSVSGSH